MKRLSHVTLNGRTLFYSTDTVWVNGQIVYQGAVTFGMLIALSKVI